MKYMRNNRLRYQSKEWKVVSVQAEIKDETQVNLVVEYIRLKVASV